MDHGGLEELLIARGLNAKSVRIYLGYLVRAQEWLAEHGATLDDATAALMSAWMGTLRNTYATKRLARCAVVAYWEETDRQHPPKRALRVPPEPQGICRALEEDDARLLVKTARGWDPHEQGPEGVAVLLGMRQALRAGEIASVRWDRFDADGGMTVTGKGDRTRRIPVHPDVADALAGWRHVSTRRPRTSSSRTRPGETYVFAGRKPRPHVTPTTVWTWVRRVADVAGIQRMPAHHMRHTCLAEINDRTGDLRTAQAIAGHAKPETTSRYTRATWKRMRSAILAVHYE